MDLGSQSCLREVLLGGLSVQKSKKTNGFLRFLKRLLFGSFWLLIALLGSCWQFLVPYWSQEGSNTGNKSEKKDGLKFNYGPMKSFTTTFMLSYFLLFF